MPISGDPRELRALAAAAKRAASEIAASYRVLDSKHRATRYSVPNRAQVDDLFRKAAAEIRSSTEALAEIEKRMIAIALALEKVNR